MSINSLSIFFLVCYLSVSIISASPHALPVQNPLNSAARSAHPQEYILKSDFDIHAKPTTRRYNLTVTETKAALDGFLRQVMAINGQIPGPLIEANEGDRLEITVINKMNIELTMHWHGLYQASEFWEDGVTGVTQCPIPSNGGIYTYKFDTNGQRHKRPNDSFARDPLKRSIDFDHDVVLMMADWYHNTSSDIVQEMLSEAGYFGTPAAPGANCALINGVGQWNCSLATTTQQCNQVTSPPEFTVTAGQRIRFRLINAGVHAMFFFSVDEHMLNITEADSTGIYGPSDFRHIWLHNGQRYSVIVQTKEEDVGRNFYMRATMNSDCWAWVPNDIQDTALGILRLAHDDARPENVSKARPDTQGWPQDFPQECIDIDPSLMVPILKSTVPASVVGWVWFQLINNTAEHLTREEAVRLAKEAHHDSSRDPNLRGKKKYVTISHRAKHYRDRSDGSAEDLHDVCRVPATFHGKGGGYQENSSSRHAAVDTGQEKNRQHNPQRFGGRKSPAGITRLAGPPPTPAGTIGKYFVNNVSWTTFPYQPVLHDLTPGGVGTINGSRVANVIFPTAEWYDLYLVNVDAAGSHPYHLHAMDMHIVAYGRGFPTPEKLSKIKYSTENPLRRDTVVVPSASFVVVRLNADIPGAWIMVLLIRIL
ncbi:hypothetical protein PSHT_06340 [Puccinia striiformis]|uniref:Plastocyanin-like domain-containing protein n=1 Tax=Puccinia striiformis TaxID=27350 RepID=A0A2S4W6V0_9BASI|nr:hypothetical protein PSHT_06340 [Puccinia striiformis]